MQQYFVKTLQHYKKNVSVTVVTGNGHNRTDNKILKLFTK